MKELIVLVASIMLGIVLFSLIAGTQEGSVYSDVKDVWQTEVEIRTMEDGL